jgi:prepilin-type N-terminal cleavage/methylation domain-containing protein
MVSTRSLVIPRRYRAAFTLVELLVVIAIIGVLVALLLPAVQAAREAARRMSCQNNVKQIGLALHNHHDVYGTFPAGGVTNGPCCGTESGGTWTIFILPYLEQKNLYERYDFTKTNENAANAFVRTQHVKTYSCPTDPLIRQLLVPASGPGQVANLQYATGSYRAMAGVTDGLRWFDAECGRSAPLQQRGILHSTSDPMSPPAFPGGYTAPPYGKERMANITDGTSNTLMVGEYYTGPKSTPRRSTFWAYTYTSFNQSEVVLPPQSRQLFADYNRCDSFSSTSVGGGNPCKRAWGSYHPNSISFVNGDGSIRSISTNIDMIVFAALATIENGETINAP